MNERPQRHTETVSSAARGSSYPKVHLVFRVVSGLSEVASLSKKRGKLLTLNVHSCLNSHAVQRIKAHSKVGVVAVPR